MKVVLLCTELASCMSIRDFNHAHTCSGLDNVDPDNGIMHPNCMLTDRRTVYIPCNDYDLAMVDYTIIANSNNKGLIKV